MDAPDHAAADGSAKIDHSWKRMLRREIDRTPLAATLEEAVGPLARFPEMDMEILLGVIGDVREEWKDVIYSPTGVFKLPRSYRLDFAVAINIYTQNHPAVYKIVNREMFNPDRRKAGGSGQVSDALRACLPYVKFLEEALKALPVEYVFKGKVRRGVKWVYPSPDHHDPEAHFVIGQLFCWYEFKSTSKEMAVMTREHFCGVAAGPRTIFEIYVTFGFDISVFSAFQGLESEHEVLLLPLSVLRVVSVVKNIIDPKETGEGTQKLQKSGFPDAVQCVQVVEVADPAERERAERERAKQEQERVDAELARKLHLEEKEKEAAARAEAEKKKEEEAAFWSSLASKNIGGIVRGLVSCAGNPRLQAKGFEALVDLMRGNDPNRVSVANAGAIPLIVRNMRQHSQDAEVQHGGCRAFVELAVNDDNNVKIGEEGGIEVILEALRQHSGHAEIQECGCAALGNLANDDDNQVKIGEEGGIKVIVEALRQHPTHGGCHALANLSANNADNKSKIGVEGGIEVIVEALRQHPTNAEVQENGCLSLNNIGSSDRQLQKQIKQAGAEATVQAAMGSAECRRAHQEVWRHSVGEAQESVELSACLLFQYYYRTFLC